MSAAPTSASEAASSSCIASTSSTTTTTTPTKDDSNDGWYRVCSVTELPIGSSKCIDVGGRPLVIFRTGSEGDDGSPHLYCLDRICYHMGGPLDSGDIEDIHGTLVVSCPWHRYKIALEDGSGLYQATPGQWKSKGRRQRTHEVKIDEKGENIIVKINQDTEELSSDGYNAPERYKAMQQRMGKQPSSYQYTIGGSGDEGCTGGGGGSGSRSGLPSGYQRSGHVFAANRAAAEAAKYQPNQ